MNLKKKIKNKYKIIKKYPETSNSKTGEIVDGIAIYPEEIEKVAKQMEVPVHYVKDGVLLHEYIHKEYPKLSPKKFSKKFKELFLKLYPDIKKEYFKKILDFSGHFSKADMEIYNKYGMVKVVNPENDNPKNPKFKEISIVGKVLKEPDPTEFLIKQYEDYEGNITFDLFYKYPYQKKFKLALENIKSFDFLKEFLLKNHNKNIEEVPIIKYVWGKRGTRGFGWIKEDNLKGQENNLQNPNMEEEKLPKFESYYQLESYLRGKGYGHILDEIYDLEFKIRPEGWKRKDVEDMILEWWNSDLEESLLKSERIGYFLMWHLKKEIVKETNPSNPGNPKRKSLKKEAMEWFRNIAYNYNHDIDMDILSQLIDMAKDLGLDVDKVQDKWQYFYPSESWNRISAKELYNFYEDIIEEAENRQKLYEEENLINPENPNMNKKIVYIKKPNIFETGYKIVWIDEYGHKHSTWEDRLTLEQLKKEARREGYQVRVVDEIPENLNNPNNPNMKKEKLITYDIEYTDVFESTPDTPVAVQITEEKENELYEKYGYNWYFISDDLIKYFDDEEEEWKIAKVVPDRVITAKEMEKENPSNPETKGISWLEIYDYFQGEYERKTLDLVEFKKKAPKDFYERFKKYWEEETGEDLEERIKTEDPLYTTLYTLDALKEEYLEVAEESGVPEPYISYLDAEAMIEDDRMSGYLNYIEFGGVKVYYRTY